MGPDLCYENIHPLSMEPQSTVFGHRMFGHLAGGQLLSPGCGRRSGADPGVGHGDHLRGLLEEGSELRAVARGQLAVSRSRSHCKQPT